MDKTIFYAPDILSNLELPQEESGHCVRVLRKKVGDEILITDGKGNFYESIITDPHQKRCTVQIINTINQPRNWKFDLHIAFAPTKNIDRIEWFVEKATEIGIDRFTPTLCDHSERRQFKSERIEKILISAMKQSQKATLPILDDFIAFEKFVKQKFEGQKLIAHCYDVPKSSLKDIYCKGEPCLILIGPEGDFSEKEVKLALESGFKPVSLGESRLRTETAALVACHSIHALNW